MWCGVQVVSQLTGHAWWQWRGLSGALPNSLSRQALVLGRRKVALGAAGPLRYGFPLAPLSFTPTFTTPTTREKHSDTESKRVSVWE